MEQKDLKKALHHAIAKAFELGRRSKAVGRVSQTPPHGQPHAEQMENDIPATSVSVLHKDVSLSEMSQQKQMNAMANLGQRTGKPPKTPMATAPAPKAPKAPGMTAKKESPLKSFMQKKEEKRATNECSDEACPCRCHGVERMDKAKNDSPSHGIPGKNRPLYERGVNPTVAVSTSKFGGDAKERSLQGIKVRRGDIAGAKTAAKEILGEQKKMLKPKLAKEETGHEKGVHRSFAGRGKSQMGAATKGNWSHGSPERNKKKAISEHQKVMGEMKNIKPKLEKEEHEPEHEDIFFHNTGPLGSRTSVSAGGKHIGEFKSDEEAHHAAKQWSKKNNFHPNAWQVSDHGNHHLIHDFHSEPKKIKKMMVGNMEMKEKKAK